MATTKKLRWRKSDEISLSTTEGERIDSGIVAKSFAIHITGFVVTKDSEYYSHSTYALTHTPTGKTICKLIPSIELAKELANQLNALDIDWDIVRGKKETKGSGAKKIVVAFREKYDIPDTIAPTERDNPQPEDGAKHG